MKFLSNFMDSIGRRRVITDRTGKIPYLIRYYIFLKDRKNFPFNITVHKVLVSDEPTLHDHPWDWGAIILKGGYWEHIPLFNETTGSVIGSTRRWRGPGHIRFRKADDLHCLELQKDENGNDIPCTSIFFMGRKKKEWGFVDHIRNKGYRWIHNEKYLKERSST